MCGFFGNNGVIEIQINNPVAVIRPVSFGVADKYGDIVIAAVLFCLKHVVIRYDNGIVFIHKCSSVYLCICARYWLLSLYGCFWNGMQTDWLVRTATRSDQRMRTLARTGARAHAHKCTEYIQYALWVGLIKDSWTHVPVLEFIFYTREKKSEWW